MRADVTRESREKSFVLDVILEQKKSRGSVSANNKAPLKKRGIPTTTMTRKQQYQKQEKGGKSKDEAGALWKNIKAMPTGQEQCGNQCDVKATSYLT